MFYEAVDLKFNSGTSMEVTFRDGAVKEYDMADMFDSHPELERLKDRELFLSGRLVGFYLIVWDEELDIGTDTVYESGKTVRQGKPFPGIAASDAVMAARAERGMTQMELSELTGINQADISRIERGTANPTVGTLEKIAAALGGRLNITIDILED